MTTSAVHEVEHAVSVDAPAEQVYALIADVTQWPTTFPPTVHAECVTRDGGSELIRIWATANGSARVWTSQREHDPERMSVSFRQQRSQAPVGGMGGTWIVEPVAAARCRVRLRHDFYATSDDPADVEWISSAVERNSNSELSALKASAEGSGPGQLITFADTVLVDGQARDVYDFLNQADRWPQRLPHVARVRLEEQTPGLQILALETQGPDGSLHATESVRVCWPYRGIVYKQVVTPALMSLHTGRWLIEERPGAGLAVTSEHTVRLSLAAIPAVLGPDADTETAADFVRTALSGNSLATLRAARAYAEGSPDARAAS